MVFYKPFIRFFHILRQVTEKRKLRRHRRQLCTIFYFNVFSFQSWRRCVFYDRKHDFIQLTCFNSFFTVFIDFHSGFHSFQDSLFCQCRNEQNRHITEQSYFLTNLVFKLLHGIGFFFHQIPFINQNYDSFSVFLCYPKDIHILAFPAFGSIYHQDNHIRIFYRSDGTHHRIKLQILTYFGFFTHSCRIHQNKLVPEFIINCLYAVSRSSCDIRHDVSLIAQ